MFSHGGYKNRILDVSMITSEVNVLMEENVYQLDEISITPGNYKSLLLGTNIRLKKNKRFYRNIQLLEI